MCTEEEVKSDIKYTHTAYTYTKCYCKINIMIKIDGLCSLIREVRTYKPTGAINNNYYDLNGNRVHRARHSPPIYSKQQSWSHDTAYPTTPTKYIYYY